MSNSETDPKRVPTNPTSKLGANMNIGGDVNDPAFLREMLRTAMLGIFNHGLGTTPGWMRDAILIVAERVQRHIASSAASGYRAAVATQAVLTDPLGAERPAYGEFLTVLWELPEPPTPETP